MKEKRGVALIDAVPHFCRICSLLRNLFINKATCKSGILYDRIYLTMTSRCLPTNYMAPKLAKKREAFNAALDKYAGAAEGAKNDYDAALIVHDRLIEDCDYDLTGEVTDVHNAYGALVENVAVCDGYAYAYKCIMDRLGIECRTITGTATNGMEANVGHAWNIVKLDGEWYCTDVASGKGSDGSVTYEYFNVTSEKISELHKADEDFGVELPECTATKNAYKNS